MLTIRKEQMDILEKAVKSRHPQELIEHFQADPVAEEMSSEEVAELVEHCVEKAEELEIVVRKDIFRYCVLNFVLGKDFEESDEFSWAQPILTNLELNGELRLKFILDELDEREADDDEEIL